MEMEHMSCRESPTIIDNLRAKTASTCYWARLDVGMTEYALKELR